MIRFFEFSPANTVSMASVHTCIIYRLIRVSGQVLIVFSQLPLDTVAIVASGKCSILPLVGLDAANHMRVCAIAPLPCGRISEA